MAACRKLGQLRLSANRFRELPNWLLDLPEPLLPLICRQPVLLLLLLLLSRELEGCSPPPRPGEGASGIISKGKWNATGQEVREILWGKITDHPDKEGLFMQRVPTCFGVLGLPPSLQSRTRGLLLAGDQFNPTPGFENPSGCRRRRTPARPRRRTGRYIMLIMCSTTEEKQDKEEEGGTFFWAISARCLSMRITKPNLDERELRVGVAARGSASTGARILPGPCGPKFSEITRQFKAP
ncbi:hypothetical protein F4811DRAFT_555111 [Daldinia bambusicola]|nr:hypothetical protein F4811DRAFT_555111 [Daldinia bambusicola]